MTSRRLVYMLLAVMLMTSAAARPVFAQDLSDTDSDTSTSTPDTQTTSESDETKTTPPPDLTEYDNIPEGLLVGPEKKEGDGDKQGTSPVDTTPIPSFYKPIGEEKEESDVHANSGEQRAMTIEEIFSLYKKGKYADIKSTLESMTQYSSHDAEELLGIMYLYGQGVTRDPKKAFDLLTKAAEAGRPLAEHHLGVMYFTGEGMDLPDEITALMWLHIAILHYSDGPEKDRAITDRDAVYGKLNRHDKQQAMDMVHDWLDRKGEGHLLDMQ